MIGFILEHKWLFLVSSEIIFWLTFLIFLILRYWFHSRGQLFFLYLSIINQFLNIPLAALDYIYTGHISLFQLVVLLIYIYAIIRGPIDMFRLDRYIQVKITHWKRNQRFNRSSSPPMEIIEFLNNYPAIQRKKFYVHSSLFVIAHLFYFSSLHSFWFTFLMIDGIWTLSFSLSEKKNI